jgi:hypothetical protein
MVAKLRDDRVDGMRTLRSESDAIKAAIALDAMSAKLRDSTNQANDMRSTRTRCD